MNTPKPFAVSMLVLTLCTFLLGCAGAHALNNVQLPEDKLNCLECKLALDLFKDKAEQNATEADLVRFLQDFCIAFKIEDKTVCTGIILMYKAEFFSLLAFEAESGYVCGFLGICPAPIFPKYNVTFPKPKPPHIPPIPPPINGPRGQILHVTDMHFDLLYLEGMNVDCGEPLCCRAQNGPGTGKNAAGKWGDYNCDLSPVLLASAMNQMNSTLQPDFIVWTGDNPPHNVWNQTRDTQISDSLYLTNVLKQTFPKVPVFPCVGNHEGVPVNSFQLPPNEAWLYDALGSMWSEWLSADAIKTFQYGGYYVTPIKPGLKIMSLNMNYCNSGNAWLLINMTDPGRMLEWMISELQAAEDAQEKLYLVGHIPSGDGTCIASWSYQYYQIINRYEDTIISGFFGHTHSDQFEIYYEMNSTNTTGPRPTSVAYQAPSLTPYTNINPSYRVYTVDTNSGYLTEISTYHIDLVAANANGTPNWMLEYNATTLYNMTTFFPTDWDNLIQEFKKGNYIQQYYNYISSGGPGNTGTCDVTCQKQTICSLNGAQTFVQSCNVQAGIEGMLREKPKVC